MNQAAALAPLNDNDVKLEPAEKRLNSVVVPGVTPVKREQES
eukprot:CAMPEP_0182618158 /NCGR_PEP_ID=MMETSP1330-20130603/44753_1 /TAXON_ID=464278 /ORGANISM="Picochlorum sp., Strain RCC944" /LENGTH=41 /DNA_ID= /DNA_START= /DNA_END= /DNA_ORIENTATION=